MLANLAGGQWLLAELYDITLPTGQVYHFTSFQTGLNNLTIHLPDGTTSGPFNYQSGLTIERGDITQKVGVQGGTMDLSISPQEDSPNAPILIAGYPVWQAARYGFLDGATVRMSIAALLPPAPVTQIDTSPGASGFFLGTAQKIAVDRLLVKMSVDDYLVYLGAQQMPNKLYQVGCFHQVYDSGCALLKSAFTVNGTIATAGDSAHFTTNLTQVDNYFQLGVLTFTSGVNNGQSANVASYKHSSGAFAMRFPFPVPPAPGDAFSVYPGCDLRQATCSNTNPSVGPPFNNLAHFSGAPDIPVPETMLDGNVNNPPAQTTGGQAGQIIGSGPSSRIPAGKFQT